MEQKTSQNTTPSTPKGFRDFLPEKMRVRQYVTEVLMDVFESFGFEPLQTPTLEYASVLQGKYGEEADKLMYVFEDRGGRKVGLNYDLTVPTARVLAQYQGKIPLPFKRYQIQSSYRAENPQKGRYRQFVQCDVDTFGVSSPLADAEIIAIIYTALKRLGFLEFKIRINSRQVLFGILQDAGIGDKKLQLSVLQSIDKLGKKAEAEVEEELTSKGLSSDGIKSLFEAIKKATPDENLAQMFSYLDQFGVSRDCWEFSPFMARGLDYYTGPIFETVLEKPKIGSITGGGRYDDLVSQLGGPNVPATGTTIGFERICDVIEELGLLRDELEGNRGILVTVFSLELVDQSIKVLNLLQESGNNVTLYPDPNVPLEKQLSYANKKGIPFVVIIGPDEKEKGTALIKDMESGEQETVKQENIGKAITKQAIEFGTKAVVVLG
ncbi:MAG: histidine--tRNA ligase [Candidatus Blackburnbacteria bacterium]|nr:histidine--tRNA ligase [Candidatus Blackburnbacteria bacterium]